MKKPTVRLPDALAADIEIEAQRRGVPLSTVVRERLNHERVNALPPQLADIADLMAP